MNEVVRRHRPILFALCGLAAGLFVVGAVWVGVQNYQTTQAVRQTQVNNHALLDQINDCTKPTGQCFQRGQARTAGAVASINRVVILAAACAVGKTGTETEVQAQIQACVIEGLARQNANR